MYGVGIAQRKRAGLAKVTRHINELNREFVSYKQGWQPWPDRFGTLQQMWERACPAMRRAGGARSYRRCKNNGRHLVVFTQYPAMHLVAIAES